MSTAIQLARTRASAFLARLTAHRSTTPLLPWLPKPFKLIVLLLLLCHTSSFPFLWHIRVWRWPLRAYWLHYTRGTQKYWLKWRQEYESYGGITNHRAKVYRRALFDDCDYNLHLSNSAYAKTSDACKMKLCIDLFAPSFASGMHMALGAGHNIYLREIPIGSQYLIETRIGGWGDKWVHVVTEFVIFPRKKGHGRRAQKKAHAAIDAIEEATHHAIPSISAAPASSECSDLTSSSGSDTGSPQNGFANGHANGHANGNANGHANGAAAHGSDTDPNSFEAQEAALMAKLRARAREPREDGGIVCCLSVTDYCFKQGRITVPPRIIMHLSLLSPDPKRRQHAMDVLSDPKRAAKFARGDWKNDPLADEFGMDIGLINGSHSWADGAREAMGKVGLGLAHFGTA